LDHGVVDEAIALLEIAEVDRALGEQPHLFTPRERAYAESKPDPARRLAARLAAKRAAGSLLGVPPASIEVLRGRGGPPRLVLGPDALAALRARGATTTRVSLTHGETHAAAVVLLLREGE
jgi:holo-[acyl-carrier protein] synthase